MPRRESPSCDRIARLIRAFAHADAGAMGMRHEARRVERVPALALAHASTGTWRVITKDEVEEKSRASFRFHANLFLRQLDGEDQSA